MSERTFFGFRYSLPGFTFILWNLLLNLRFIAYLFLQLLPTLELSNGVVTLFGILIGFLTLLSGGAIGFLISQVWYLIYHYCGIQKLLIRKHSRVLEDEFNVKDEEASFYVYNFTVCDTEKKEVVSFLNRRWDVFNSLGSTGCAIFVGSLLGLYLRCCVLKSPESFQTFVNWINFEWLLMGLSIFLIIVFVAIAYKVENAAIEMGIFMVRKKARELSTEEPGKKLSDYLPEEYFRSEQPQQSHEARKEGISHE